MSAQRKLLRHLARRDGRRIPGGCPFCDAYTETVAAAPGYRIHHDNGWVLVLPDPEDQLTQIWADGESTNDARRLADEYGRRISQIIR